MREGRFARYTCDAVGNDIRFCVNTAEAVAGALIEEQSSLEPGEVASGGAGGAAFGEPGFSGRVVAFELVDGVRIASSDS